LIGGVVSEGGKFVVGVDFGDDSAKRVTDERGGFPKLVQKGVGS
jgi:hypothetical protein